MFGRDRSPDWRFPLGLKFNWIQAGAIFDGLAGLFVKSFLNGHRLAWPMHFRATRLQEAGAWRRVRQRSCTLFEGEGHGVERIRRHYHVWAAAVVNPDIDVPLTSIPNF